MNDGRAFADAADHALTINPAQQRFQVGILFWVLPHDGIFDRHAEAFVYQTANNIQPGFFVCAKIVFFFEVEDQWRGRSVSDFAQPLFQSCRITRIAAGQHHRTGEFVATQKRRLIHGAPIRRSQAGNRPEFIRQTVKPFEQRVKFSQRDVIEKRVAAIQKPCQPARRHMANQAFILRKIQRAMRVVFARQRRHRKHALQISERNR